VKNLITLRGGLLAVRILFMLIMFTGSAAALTGAIEAEDGMSMAILGALVGVPKPDELSDRGGPLNAKDTLLVARWRDIAYMPSRNARGVLISEDIVFKAGKSFVELYATRDKIKIDSTGEGDLDQEGAKKVVEGMHPGLYQEVLEFAEDNKHEDLVILVRRCDGDTILLGDCGNPMRMKHNHNSDNTKKDNTFTFTSVSASKTLAIYTGAITLPDYAGLVSANATTFSVGNGEGIYRTGVNTGATTLTGITNPNHGNIYTIQGNSGSFPTNIAASSVFILKDGTTMVLTENAYITFRAFKSGESSYVFVEQSRR
jgi:hypothetical protein